VRRFGLAVEAGDARAMIEIGADADMLPADPLRDIVDMVGIFGQRRTRCRGAGRVEIGFALRGREPIAVVIGGLVDGGQAKADADLRDPGTLRLGRDMQIGGEGRELDDPAIRLDRIELRVAEVAAVVDQRAGVRMGRRDRRAAEREGLEQRIGRKLRHVDQRAEIVEPFHRRASEWR